MSGHWMLNSYSRLGARELADRIATYWHSRGDYQVETWIEPIYIKEARPDWAEEGERLHKVCSNLVNGLPVHASAR